ncbi:MAG: GNAT family N-acetyltransferase [Candidatus Heimdallarchaeota archaeon]|nr:GNAT family N-acetyltransferase [Candidatus Heimdallarchaeota archaeon]
MKDTVEFKELTDYNEFYKIEDIQIDAWGFPDREIVPKRIIYATHRSGGMVIAAYLNQEMIGYVWGWIGRSDPYGNFIYSHHNAVVREHQNRGIGIQLKLEQRKWALERNFKTINWTFDPLQSKNCYINLHKLGAISNTYKVKYWGDMHDELNIGIDTDRFYCSWIIDSSHVKKHLNSEFEDYMEIINNKLYHSIKTTSNKGILTVKELDFDIQETIIFAEIPIDFTKIMKSNNELAKEWRKETRKILTHYFNKGYSAIDFIIDKSVTPWKGYHVLKVRESSDS